MCSCITNAQLGPIGDSVSRILFIGNSITYSGGYVNNVEAYLLAHYPGKRYEIINLGLPSETVSGLSEPGHADGKFPRPDLHERLARVLIAAKPHLVFASYGMNDGIYLPFDSTRFRLFREGIEWLHREVVRSGARIIHLTPPVFDELKMPAPAYSVTLKRYSEWLLSLRKSHGWEIIDIHSPMLAYLQAHRAVDKQFNIEGFALAADGVHPGETGHWIMAREILKYLGFKQAGKAPSVVGALPSRIDATALLKAVTSRQNVLRDAWLTETRHLRPGLPTGLSMALARDSAAVLSKQINRLLK